MNGQKPGRIKKFGAEILLAILEMAAIFISMEQESLETNIYETESLYMESVNAEVESDILLYGETLEFEQQIENPVMGQEVKIVYLTFDDGPCEYTEQLLDILDRYGVKATFFVTNQLPEYQDLIGEAYRRGHSIGLHSYDHDYSIYRSKEDYYEDLQLIHDVCEEQTGEAPRIVRFPGGSSNLTSRKYGYGIMSDLCESMGEKGYLYCDWNVSSGDMENAITTYAVTQNVIKGIQGKDISIVLQHDTIDYSVEAVSEIICWGLANGYTFLPLTEYSPMAHHTVQN